MRRTAFVLFAAVSLAGCLGGSKAPARAHYVLHDRAPAGTESAAEPIKLSLVVAGGATEVFYDTESLVYSRQAGQLAYYQFASWTDRPARLVAHLAEQRLEARGRFATVANLASGVRADLVLNITIGDFYHDTAVQPSVVRVSLTAELVDWRNRSLLARRMFNASAGVQAEDAKGAADAFDQAATEALNALVPWVETEAARADPGSG